jgi:CRP-like cAMP-binding protein
MLAAIAEHGLFSGVSTQNILHLFPACLPEQYRNEEIVCRCPPEVAHHDAFLVLKGNVAFTFRKGPEQQVLEFSGLGTVFNFEGLLGSLSQDIGARALGDVEVMMMDVGKLLDIFRAIPRWAMR